jgi:predicted NBD/HSP70 family sugar kinase
MGNAVGVDLGGSSVKLAAWIDGTPRELGRFPHAARGMEVVSAVVEAVRRLPSEHATLPLGVAIAGLVRGGIVRRSGNLGLTDAPVAEAIGHALGRPLAAFTSDARAFGRAAALEEGPEPVRLALALGTGVGGALLDSGEIVKDEGLGHGTFLARESAAPCAVGHERCLEAFLGAAALVRAGRAAGLEIESVLALDALAARGDERALDVLGRAGRDLAEGVGVILDGRDALVVLGGGVARSASILAAARAALPGVRVVTSRFGDHAAAIGASALASSARSK